MSDDRPAIFALDDALKRQGISRDEVSPLNRMKLDLLCPEDICPVCHLTDEETGEIRSVTIHRSCWSHLVHGGKFQGSIWTCVCGAQVRGVQCPVCKRHPPLVH
jgi:hypothetical protein